MKHLLLISLLTVSLSGFGQTKTLEYPPKPVEARIDKKDTFYLHDVGRHCDCWQCYESRKPDTLRAICLVTLFPNGIAHARMGFVVIEQGKSVVYLDCRKRALKLPQVGWGYEVVNPNEKSK